MGVRGHSRFFIMRANPFGDFNTFILGNSGDQNVLGPYKYLTVALYLALLIVGIAVAVMAWRRDPAQRTVKHISIFAMRVAAAGMWYQASLWKLPWPVSGGFRFWLQASAKYSAFQFHSDLMTLWFVPNIAIVQPLVYLLEVFFAASLMLGFAVRLSGMLAVLFTLNLWVGLYNDPTEWAWTYIGIVMAHGMFVVAEAGRSLGLDQLLRNGLGRFRLSGGVVSQAYRLAS